MQHEGVWRLSHHTPSCCKSRLASGALYSIAHFQQFRLDFITMIALDLNGAILDGATRAAQLLELLRQRCQLCLASHHPIDNCDGFPATMLAITHHAHNTVAFPGTASGRGLIATTLFIW